MPETAVRFFRDEDGTAPILEWLESLREKNERAFFPRSEAPLRQAPRTTKHGVSNENADDESHHRFQNGFFEA